MKVGRRGVLASFVFGGLLLSFQNCSPAFVPESQEASSSPERNILETPQEFLARNVDLKSTALVAAAGGPCTAPAGVIGDGNTNDGPAIQNALTLAANSPSGGRVCLPSTAAHYDVQQTLWVGSHTTFVIHGTINLHENRMSASRYVEYDQPRAYDGSKSRRYFDNQFGIVQITPGSVNVVITGHGTLDGNASIYPEQNHQPRVMGAPATTCCFAGIVVAGPNLARYENGIRNVLIEGLHILHTQTWPITTEGATGVVLRNLEISDAGNSVQFARGTSYARAYNLRISKSNDQGFAFYNGVNNASIENSEITDVLGGGITVYNDVGGNYDDLSFQQPSHDILIAGNRVHHNSETRTIIGYTPAQNHTEHGATGIFVMNGLKGTASPDDMFFNVSQLRPYNITIYNNDVSYNAYAGILVRPCDNCSISNNVIAHDGDPLYAYASGINIAASTRLTISNNQISYEGRGQYGRSQNGGIGISMDAIEDSGHKTWDSREIVIVGNKIGDDPNQPSLMQALRGAPITPAFLLGNVVDGLSWSDFNLRSIDFSLFRVKSTIYRASAAGRYCLRPNRSSIEAEAEPIVDLGAIPFGLVNEGVCGSP